MNNSQQTALTMNLVTRFLLALVAASFCLSGCAETGNEFGSSEVKVKIAGKTALMQACEDLDPEQVQRIIAAKEMLDQQDKDGDTALHYLFKHFYNEDNYIDEDYLVADYEKTKMVLELLLSKGADPTICNKQGVSILAQAAQLRDSEILKYLLGQSKKINLAPDKAGDTLLHMAAQSGSAENVRLVLNEIQGGRELLNKQNNDGETPLMVAASINSEGHGSIDSSGEIDSEINILRMLGGGNQAFRELLKAGAATNLTDKNGETLLATVINTKAHSNMVQLMKKGVSPNQPNIDGTYPLQQAISNCDGVAAHILIQAGASTTATGSIGLSATKLAKIKAEVCEQNTEKLLLMLIASKAPHKL